MKSKKKLVEEYIQKIISKLCYEYGTSLEDARKAVEELDLLNRYKGNYDFVLYQNVSTWVNLIVNKHKVNKRKKEVERENLENKTTVRPQSNHILSYSEQPTTKNTKYGDIVLYKHELWINDGNIVMPMSYINLDNYIDKDGTILDKPLTKNYVDEKFKKTLKENTMDNYIVINGKKIELTEEQLKQLGIEVKVKKETLFTRHSNELYWSINATNGVVGLHDYNVDFDNALYDNVNYFNDYKFAKQVALHQLLYRKLLKYAYDNGAEDCDWDNNNTHYYIFFDSKNCNFKIDLNTQIRSQNIYFSKSEVARQAIEDVIKPFMIENPEFVW
nr:MAG TPA: hypothetical protein [Caudoviricetes sp.]